MEEQFERDERLVMTSEHQILPKERSHHGEQY